MAAQIGSSAIDRSLQPYSMCMWTNSNHPSGGRIKVSNGIWFPVNSRIWIAGALTIKERLHKARYYSVKWFPHPFFSCQLTILPQIL